MQIIELTQSCDLIKHFDARASSGIKFIWKSCEGIESDEKYESHEKSEKVVDVDLDESVRCGIAVPGGRNGEGFT